MKKILFMALMVVTTFVTSQAWAQSQTQTIKGIVIDKASMVSIPGVNIVIVGSTPLKGANTDMDGRLKLNEVQPGRYDLKVSYIGYKELVIPNVVVTAGKEVVVEIAVSLMQNRHSVPPTAPHSSHARENAFKVSAVKQPHVLVLCQPFPYQSG